MILWDNRTVKVTSAKSASFCHCPAEVCYFNSLTANLRLFLKRQTHRKRSVLFPETQVLFPEKSHVVWCGVMSKSKYLAVTYVMNSCKQFLLLKKTNKTKINWYSLHIFRSISLFQFQPPFSWNKSYLMRFNSETEQDLCF